MKQIRSRDTIIYYLINSIVFTISVYFYFYEKPIYWITAGPLLLLDIYFLENTLDIYRSSRMKVLSGWMMRYIVYWIAIYFFTNQEQPLSNYFWIFFILACTKLVILTWSAHRLKKNKVTYNTVLIGDGDNAQQLAEKFLSHNSTMGQKIVGVIGKKSFFDLPLLGNADQLSATIQNHTIEECIIALENNETQQMTSILNTLRSFHSNVLTRITPVSYDLLMGHIRLNALYSEPLIELPSGKMPRWQIAVKRIADILISILLLLILFPFILFIVFRIKLTSSGPVFYSQVRIGKNGKPFNIFKFRSMLIDAEADQPMLSNDHDPRVTPFGKVMRKWRLDEIPQFINVLRGEMSIVGPRPEREYFINLIKEKAPFYTRILTVRPGITSWGQVKFGYATNVNQMVERLKYDLIYIENQTLTLDIKIILYTILVLFQGKGK